VLGFGVTITPDPVKAGTRENVTVAVVKGGYPDKEKEGGIEIWLKSHFPDTKVDDIEVETPDEFKVVLNARVASRKRYGEPELPQTDPISDKDIQLLWPTDYPVITQGFGANPQIYGQWGLPGHEGLDIRAPHNTNVYACADGDVFKIETRSNAHPYGRHIRIQHANGYRTVYGHLYQVLVKEGDKVEAKQLIGKANSTGNSSGSHLHVTLKKEGATARNETNFKGDVIDPTPYMVLPK
ncbi:M23 family metallopeptidase, partial [Chloroflexota bacterium]